MALKNPKSGQWKLLYSAAIIIDAAQWGIDLIPFAGAGVNEVADPAIGFCFVLYFQLAGVSMVQRPSRLASLVGGYLAEAFSGSIAPAWVVDVWYIRRSVKEEWAEQAALNEDDDANGPQPLYQNGVRRAETAQGPLNKGGLRQPIGPQAA